jgi:hypothetical protein
MAMSGGGVWVEVLQVDVRENTWMEKLYISLDDLGSIIEPTVPESLVDRIMQA